MEGLVASLRFVFPSIIGSDFVFDGTAVVHKLAGSAVLELVSCLREGYRNHGM